MQFDVLVIGGGIAGVSIASELAASRRVGLLEQESHLAYHSTGRSAALFMQSYGNAVVRALTRASKEFLFSPPDGFAEGPITTCRGALHVARTDQLQILHEFLSQGDVGRVATFVGPADIEKLSPLLKRGYSAGGAYEPSAREIDVHNLHYGYLRKLRHHGGEVFTDACCLEITLSRGVWIVRTAEKTFEAAILVNAAGAWAEHVGALAGAQPLSIAPMRRTAVLVDCPIAPPPSAFTLDIGETFYFKPEGDGVLLSPADETPSAACDAQPEELDVAIAIDRLEAVTGLQVSHVRQRWAGLRSFAPDRSPVIGFDANASGFFWFAGQGGYGIQTSPAASRMGAALIDRQSVPADLSEAGVTAELASPLRFSGDAASAIID